MIPPVPDVAVTLVVEFEGFSASPYRCLNRKWTIGHGSSWDMKGNPVTAYTPDVTRAQARIMVRRDMTGAGHEVDRSVKVPLNRNQRGALLSFVYNLGSGNFRSSSLLRKLNQGDYIGASHELARWNKVGRVVLAGLVKRRRAEQQLFDTPLDHGR